MKYLAILSDSLREAIDTKVFYVMVALSAILMLVVGSVSFRPRPAAELAEMFTTVPLNVDPAALEKAFLTGLPPAQRSAGLYTQVKVEPVDDAPDNPSSPLVFTVRAMYLQKEEAAKVKAAPAGTKEFIKENFASIGQWKILEVTRVDLAETRGPSNLDFQVWTRPTSSTLRVWPHEPVLFFGLTSLSGMPWPFSSLGFQIWFIEDQLVNGLGAWVAILVSVVITAFFVPNMLRKGSIDLLLVKPMYRTTLLLYKYIGGLSFIFLNTSVAIVGIWLVLGLRSGIWATGFLWTILIITFFFAILYSISTLCSVLTQSPIVAILATCLAWLVFFAAGHAYAAPEQLRASYEAQKTPPERRILDPDGRWVDVVKAVHLVLPRVKDLDYLTTELLMKDLLTSNQINMQQRERNSVATFSWRESLTVDGVFTAIMLGLSCFRFATKDY